MAAVMGLPGPQVREVCAAVAGVVVLANHNSDTQVVICGEVAAVAAAGEALKAAGAKRVIPLNVSGAFHSPLLEGAAAEFRAFLEGIAINDPAVPLVANVSAQPAVTAAALREGFARQLTAPVLWHDTMELICAGPVRPPGRAGGGARQGAVRPGQTRLPGRNLRPGGDAGRPRGLCRRSLAGHAG